MMFLADLICYIHMISFNLLHTHVLFQPISGAACKFLAAACKLLAIFILSTIFIFLPEKELKDDILVFAVAYMYLYRLARRKHQLYN